jgi:RND family efflux transporter MFP subunit
MLAEAEAKIKTADAELLQATAAVEPARLDVEYSSIKAPIAGRAGRRLVDKGNVVAAGVTALLSIQRLDPIHVEFTITEDNLAIVQRSMGRRALRAEVRLSNEVGAKAPQSPPDGAPSAAPASPSAPTNGSSHRAAETDPLMRAGNIVFLDNALQESTGTIRMRVSLENADGRFWPGRFARVRLLLETLEGAVLVPAGAPQVSAHGPFVYILKDVPKEPPKATNPSDSASAGPPPPWSPTGLVADMRLVRVGQRHGDLVMIEDGLSPGDRVIIERQMFLFPGMPVRVSEAGPGGAPPAGGGPAAGMEPSK